MPFKLPSATIPAAKVRSHVESSSFGLSYSLVFCLPRGLLQFGPTPSLINLDRSDQPFGFKYTFDAPNYAKDVGGLLLVRPRVVGVKAEGFLETKEPRKFSVEFDGPVHDSDTFDITIPQGFVVDDTPPPVDVDDGFASYHAKTEINGNLIHYSRTFEVKELSVPVARAEDLIKFYRIVNTDERNTVVLKQQGK